MEYTHMKYTYEEYRGILERLRDHGYAFVDFHDAEEREKSVILRHDIDSSVEKAAKFAEFEHAWGGYRATYFVMLSSDFYNPFSKASSEALKRIQSFGHKIGLHFDETKYFRVENWNRESMIKEILKEKKILESMIDAPVDVISMHRPSKKTLEADLVIPGMVNSYGKAFFNEIKYVSDSYHRWRENIYEIIEAEPRKMQLLTHAFWYNDVSVSRSQAFRNYIDGARDAAYRLIEENSLPPNVTLAESFAEDEE